jgi:hypothetical protein
VSLVEPTRLEGYAGRFYRQAPTRFVRVDHRSGQTGDQDTRGRIRGGPLLRTARSHPPSSRKDRVGRRKVVDRMIGVPIPEALSRQDVADLRRVRILIEMDRCTSGCAAP